MSTKPLVALKVASLSWCCPQAGRHLLRCSRTVLSVIDRQPGGRPSKRLPEGFSHDTFASLEIKIVMATTVRTHSLLADSTCSFPKSPDLTSDGVRQDALAPGRGFSLALLAVPQGGAKCSAPMFEKQTHSRNIFYCLGDVKSIRVTCIRALHSWSIARMLGPKSYTGDNPAVPQKVSRIKPLRVLQRSPP